VGRPGVSGVDDFVVCGGSDALTTRLSVCPTSVRDALSVHAPDEVRSSVSILDILRWCLWVAMNLTFLSSASIKVIPYA